MVRTAKELPENPPGPAAAARILDRIDRQITQGSVTGAVDQLYRSDGAILEDIKLDAGVPATFSLERETNRYQFARIKGRTLLSRYC